MVPIRNETRNLNLAQAVQSGLPFQRDGWGDSWLELRDGGFYWLDREGYGKVTTPVLVSEDWFLVSDWQVREAEFTESQFWYAYGSALNSMPKDYAAGYAHAYAGQIVRKMADILGFQTRSDGQTDLPDVGG